VSELLGGEAADAVRPYTFVIKLVDRPGGMESVAATLAHRGVSIDCTVGNDGALDPDGRATVLITFTATPARKEALRNALRRLSRVVTVSEHGGGPSDAALRKVALLRLAPGASPPAFADGDDGMVEAVGSGEDGCPVYAVLGPVEAVDEVVGALQTGGWLRAITYATVGL
jgi:hypothetical protein